MEPDATLVPPHLLHKFKANQVNGMSLWASGQHLGSLWPHTMKPLCKYKHAREEVNRLLPYLVHRVPVSE